MEAYQAHYNRSDFAVSVSPMRMDAFKRWAGLTAEEKPFTGKLTETFIVLEKSQNLRELSTTGNVPAFVGAANSPAGNRCVGNGTVINQIVAARRTPPANVKDLKPDPREHIEAARAERNVESQKKVRENLEFEKPLEKPAERFYIQDTEPYKVELDKDQIEANRHVVEEDEEVALANTIPEGEKDD